MSRAGVENCGPILAAAARWRDQALLHDGSMFGANRLWSLEGFKGLDKYFVQNLDEAQGTFMGKLQGQLAPAPTKVKQLAAELTWVMLLCPSNTLPPRKRETIGQVWSWSGEALPDSANPWLSDEVLDGLGSAGPAYNNHRWRELVFAIRVGMAFKAISAKERAQLMADGWEFAKWLEEIPESAVRQFRHMLLYLLFPDSFERLFGGGDRRLIVQKLRGLTPVQVRKLSALQMDRELAEIRNEQEALHPEVKVDFYIEPLKSKWLPTGFEEYTADIEEDDVRAALHEVDEKGVPPSAESTVYDLVEGVRRYPPKLVLSLAAKHSSGKEFDRTLFAGGIDSAAFKILRGLGFHIERKDAIPDLLSKFIAQAQAGSSLTVKGYVSTYRGLTTRVSFGKGTPAPVPWIAFLAPGQQVQNGIYPGYLYFKSAGLLLLTKGVSDTESPSKRWPSQDGDKTVEQYFRESLGRRADKYPDSIVSKAYKIPLEVDEDQLTADLDAVISLYEDAIGELPPPSSSFVSGTGAITEMEEPSPEPYSVSQATEALFISQEQFEDILAVWRQKKNLVLQGPPGVGKTFFHRQLAYALMGVKAPTRLATVQFHPSYAYEDFVQGYRPNETGFSLRDGVFLRFCQRARQDSGHPYVFVVDEINRGNLAKIFGELLMLLEADKRNQEWAIPLAYSLPGHEHFFVPDNIYVLGLMNTADRSLAVVDYALRRRFAFVNIEPAYQSARFAEYLKEKGVGAELLSRIVLRMTALNTEIAQDKTNLGPGFCIGHSFFCNPPDDPTEHEDWFQQVVTTEIAPLLNEYYFDDPERAGQMTKPLLAGL